jgi:hypothetical protein
MFVSLERRLFRRFARGYPRPVGPVHQIRCNGPEMEMHTALTVPPIRYYYVRQRTQNVCHWGKRGLHR